MKAITLWQPWASLIACGAKMIETRGWATKHRGMLAIHAAAALQPESREAWRSHELQQAMQPFCQLDKLPRGCLLAVVYLEDVVRTTDIRFCTLEKHWVKNPSPEKWRRGTYSHGARLDQHAMGNFDPGRYAWLLTSCQKLAKPIRYSGARRMFEVPDTIMSHVEGPP